MANYRFSVHYDYCVTVDVEADNYDAAYEAAQVEADATPLGEGNWMMELDNIWCEYSDDEEQEGE